MCCSCVMWCNCGMQWLPTPLTAAPGRQRQVNKYVYITNRNRQKWTSRKVHTLYVCVDPALGHSSVCRALAYSVGLEIWSPVPHKSGLVAPAHKHSRDDQSHAWIHVGLRASLAMRSHHLSFYSLTCAYMCMCSSNMSGGQRRACSLFCSLSK